RIAIFAVELLDDFHSLNHPPESCESLVIQSLIAAQVDENLRRAGVSARRGKRDGSHPVGVSNGVVVDWLVPLLGHLRTGGNSELRDKVGDDAKEPSVIVVSVLDQLVETVRAVRRPLAVRLNYDPAFAGDKPDLINLRSADRAGGRRLIFWR